MVRVFRYGHADIGIRQMIPCSFVALSKGCGVGVGIDVAAIAIALARVG